MRQILEEIIKEWRQFKLPQIRERNIDLLKFADMKVRKAISVIGFRRSGKTFLLFDFAKKIGIENTIYINFEDERIHRETETLTTLLHVVRELCGTKKVFLLLDEIQNIPNWSRWVRRTIETQDYPLIISGSSSKLSSNEIPTELRGRTLTVEVHPLNFIEFLTFKGFDRSTLSKVDVLNTMREYLNWGGFPEIVLLQDEGLKYLNIDEYYRTFLVRDIFERHRLRQQSAMKDIIRLLINSTYITMGKLTNSAKSMGYKIGKTTVGNYINWLEESFFVSFLEIISPKVKDRVQYPRKPYFVDNFFIKRFSTSFSQNLGKLMENVVAQKLLREASNGLTTQVFYWKDYQQREVDFVYVENLAPHTLIQVTYASSYSEIPEREIASLLRASEELQCDNLTVITWDYEGKHAVKGKEIKFIPLIDFLLQSA